MNDTEFYQQKNTEKQMIEKYKKLVPMQIENNEMKFCKWVNVYYDYLWDLYTDLLKILKSYKVQNINKIKFKEFVEFTYFTSSKYITKYP